MYKLARAQLSAIDSISIQGRLLLGMISIHLGEYNTARTIFNRLLSDTVKISQVNFGMGITQFHLGELDSALYYLQQVKTIPEMYKVHYWRGRVFEDIGENNKAILEYRKALDQIFQHLNAGNTE
jgi:tetratricopeptide (TPR) repeat protein